MIARARLLPPWHPLRTSLLFDLDQLRVAWEWMHGQDDVPAAAFGVLGLLEGHLAARLACCEERANETHGGPR